MKHPTTKFLVIRLLVLATIMFVGSAMAAKGGNKPPKPGSGGGNDCNLEFDAVFRDAGNNGLESDTQGSYVAAGGTGFRLDTNGSIKLERKNDTRFVLVNFAAAGVCANDNFDPAGFCEKDKGIDLRFEHQVQSPDMCPLILGTVDSMPMVIRVGFEADSGHTLLNGGSSPGSGATTLSLNYGCVGPNLDPDHAQDPGVVTRLDAHTWTIEGTKACLHTNLGSILKDGNNVVYLDMPFLITITDVNKP